MVQLGKWLYAALYDQHWLGYPIGLEGKDVKLNTPGTPWYHKLLLPYSSNSATYTPVTNESVLPGIADLVESTNLSHWLAFWAQLFPPYITVIRYTERTLQYIRLALNLLPTSPFPPTDSTASCNTSFIFTNTLQAGWLQKYNTRIKNFLDDYTMLFCLAWPQNVVSFLSLSKVHKQEIEDSWKEMVK